MVNSTTKVQWSKYMVAHASHKMGVEDFNLPSCNQE